MIESNKPHHYKKEASHGGLVVAVIFVTLNFKNQHFGSPQTAGKQLVFFIIQYTVDMMHLQYGTPIGTVDASFCIN